LRAGKSSQADRVTLSIDMLALMDIDLYWTCLERCGGGVSTIRRPARINTAKLGDLESGYFFYFAVMKREVGKSADLRLTIDDFRLW
jgi:hypothetical protein